MDKNQKKSDLEYSYILFLMVGLSIISTRYIKIIFIIETDEEIRRLMVGGHEKNNRLVFCWLNQTLYKNHFESIRRHVRVNRQTLISRFYNENDFLTVTNQSRRGPTVLRFFSM